MFDGKYIDYLESTGDQYIFLYQHFTNNTRIVLDMMFKDTANSYFIANPWRGLNKLDSKIGFINMTGTATNPSYGKLNVRTTMDYTLTGKLYFDGNEVHDFTQEHFDFNSENLKVGLFGKDNTFKTTGFRLYELKWYESNELVGHYKPCVDSNGVGCLYDLISETYLYCPKETYEPFICGAYQDTLYLFGEHKNARGENLGNYRLYN